MVHTIDQFDTLKFKCHSPVGIHAAPLLLKATMSVLILTSMLGCKSLPIATTKPDVIMVATTKEGIGKEGVDSCPSQISGHG